MRMSLGVLLMKKLLIMLLSITLVTGLTGCVKNNNGDSDDIIQSGENAVRDNVELLEYNSSDFGVNIKYPSDWTYIEGESEVTFYYGYDESTGSSIADVNLTVADITGEDTDLDNIKDTMVQSLSESGMEITKDEKILVDGDIDAYRLGILAKNKSGTGIKIDRTVISEFGLLYLLTFEVREQDYNSFIGDYNNMLESFDIVTFTMDDEGNVKGEN